MPDLCWCFDSKWYRDTSWFLAHHFESMNVVKTTTLPFDKATTGVYIQVVLSTCAPSANLGEIPKG